MIQLKFCSNCGKKNNYGFIDGNKRYYCKQCNIIHYENPKPTATLVCPRNNNILLVKRAHSPQKGKWCLPGGFIEKGENPKEAAIRELKEETNLDGKIDKLLGTCSNYNTIFGDILLIGYEMTISNWETLRAGDDASAAKLFNINNLPKLAFPCHLYIFKIYRLVQKNKTQH